MKPVVGWVGRQWVAGYDGERLYGVWLMPADEPVVVADGGRRVDGRDVAVRAILGKS